MKKSKTIPLEELFDRAKERLPEEVGAALIITSNNGNLCTFVAGIDSMGMSPDCVAFVCAMRQLMDGKLRIAKTIYDKLASEGRIEADCTETVVENREPEEKAKPCRADSPKEVLCDLINAIFGDDDDDDDDGEDE